MLKLGFESGGVNTRIHTSSRNTRLQMRVSSTYGTKYTINGEIVFSPLKFRIIIEGIQQHSDSPWLNLGVILGN